MKKMIFFIFVLYAPSSMATTVITCGDALSVGSEAKILLHQAAQKRAQQDIENFTGKKLTIPYVDDSTACFSKSKCVSMGTAKATADIVETFWCETSSTPLHSAYYSLYSSSKLWFDERYSR
jgi:hypothetical protein